MVDNNNFWDDWDTHGVFCTENALEVRMCKALKIEDFGTIILDWTEVA